MLEHHKKTLAQSLFGFAGLAGLIITILIATASVTKADDTIGLTSAWCNVYQGLSL